MKEEDNVNGAPVQEEKAEETVEQEVKHGTKEDTPTAPPPEEGPGKVFDFGDIYFYCGACKADVKIAEALRGISYTVPAAEKAEVKMECTECGNMIKLYFKESSPEAAEARKLELEEREKAYKEAQASDGTSQEDKQGESISGDVDDSERAVEANEEAAGDTVGSDEAGSTMEA